MHRYNPGETGLYNDANCTNNYIASTNEYMEALGLYGLWLLIIGGISTLLLYSIFLEQVFFSQRQAHRVFRRHIFWIASVYPFMTMMSLVSVIVPRAHNICSGVKTTYMAIGITHFTDLTLLMYGSEEVMLAKTSKDKIDLRVGPVCCCCRCLPSPKSDKMALRMTMFLCDQLPFSQAAYYITLLVLIAGNNVKIGDVNPGNAFFYMTLLNMLSFMSGVWGLQILSKMSRDHLQHYNYNNKSFSMKTLVLVTNFQTLILEILGNYKVFPCIPPYISRQVFRQTVENSLYFIEMLILGCYTYYQYHNREFLYPNPTEVSPEDAQGHGRSETISTTVSSNSGIGDYVRYPNDQLTIIAEEAMAPDGECEADGTVDCPDAPLGPPRSKGHNSQAKNVPRANGNKGETMDNPENDWGIDGAEIFPEVIPGSCGSRGTPKGLTGSSRNEASKTHHSSSPRVIRLNDERPLKGSLQSSTYV